MGLKQKIHTDYIRWGTENTVQWHLQHTGLVLHKAGDIGVG